MLKKLSRVRPCRFLGNKTSGGWLKPCREGWAVMRGRPMWGCFMWELKLSSSQILLEHSGTDHFWFPLHPYFQQLFCAKCSSAQLSLLLLPYLLYSEAEAFPKVEETLKSPSSESHTRPEALSMLLLGQSDPPCVPLDGFLSLLPLIFGWMLTSGEEITAHGIDLILFGFLALLFSFSFGSNRKLSTDLLWPRFSPEVKNRIIHPESTEIPKRIV